MNPSSSPTTNWKSYTNSEWHYQIQYPDNWDLKEYEYGKHWVWLTNNYGRIDIGVQTKTTDTLEAEAQIRGQSHTPMCSVGSSCEGLPPKEVQKLSDPRFHELYKVIDEDNTLIFIFSLPKDASRYIEIRTRATKDSGDDSQVISEKILSNFNFTN